MDEALTAENISAYGMTIGYTKLVLLGAVLGAVLVLFHREDYSLPYSSIENESKATWSDAKGYFKWGGKSRRSAARKACDKLATKNKQYFEKCKGLRKVERKNCIEKARPACIDEMQASAVYDESEVDDAVKLEQAVALYRDVGFQGPLAVHPSGNDAYSSVKENDAISSIWINPQSGHRVTVFEDINFRGRSKTYTKSTRDLGEWSDRISSYVIKAKKK